MRRGDWEKVMRDANISIAAMLALLFCVSPEANAQAAREDGRMYGSGELFCSHGIVFTKDGQRVRTEKGDHFKFSSNEECVRSVKGSFICSHGVLYRTDGKRVRSKSGASFRWSNNQECIKSIP